jgi:hypothetical protein
VNRGIDQVAYRERRDQRVMRRIAGIEQAPEVLVRLGVTPVTERAHASGDLTGREQEAHAQRHRDLLDLGRELLRGRRPSPRRGDERLNHLRAGRPQLVIHLGG